MKAFRGLLVAGALAFGFATAAQAAPVQFVDTFTPTAGVALSGNGVSYSFQHDITYPTAATNALVATIDGVVTAGAGFDAATDVLDSALLTLTFSSGSGNWTNGKFMFLLDGVPYGNLNFAQTIQFDDTQFNIGLITNDGLLSVNVLRTNGAGTAIFQNSVLAVSGERNVNNGPVQQEEIPVPASLMLLGVGLAGLGLRRRKAA